MIITYIKWSATFVTVMAALINAMGFHPLGPMLFLIGGFLWLVVGIRWKEMTIIVTNIAIIGVTIIGLMLPKVMVNIIPIIQTYLG